MKGIGREKVKLQGLADELRREKEAATPERQRKSAAKKTFGAESVRTLELHAKDIFGNQPVSDRQYAETLLYIEAHAQISVVPPDYETVQAWLQTQTPDVRGKAAEFLSRLKAEAAPSDDAPRGTGPTRDTTPAPGVSTAAPEDTPSVDSSEREDNESLSAYARRTLTDDARALIVKGRTRRQRVVLRVDADRDGTVSDTEMQAAYGAALQLMEGTDASTVLTVNRRGYLVLKESKAQDDALAFGEDRQTYVRGAALEAVRSAYLSLAEVAKQEGRISDAKSAAAGLTKAAAAGDSAAVVKHAKDYLASLEALNVEAKLKVYAELTLANALLQDGKGAAARKALERASALAPAGMEPQLTLMEARVDAVQGKLNRAHRRLKKVTQNSEAPLALKEEAKALLAGIELNFLSAARGKLGVEIKVLDAIHDEKVPKSAWAALNPVNSIAAVSGYWDNWLSVHQQAHDELTEMQTGLMDLAHLSKRSGIPISELARMDSEFLFHVAGNAFKGLSRHDITRIANSAARGLTHPDVRQIARGDLDGEFSWDTGKTLVDVEQFDLPSDTLAKYVGSAVRSARKHAEHMKGGAWLTAGFGEYSAVVLDSFTVVKRLTKDQLKSSAEFYAKGVEQGGVIGASARVGAAFTFLGEMVAFPVTAGATALDSTIDDKERAEAIAGIGAMTVTWGLVRGVSAISPGVTKYLQTTRLGAPMVARLEAVTGYAQGTIARGDRWLSQTAVGQAFDSSRTFFIEHARRLVWKSTEKTTRSAAAPTGTVAKGAKGVEQTLLREAGDEVLAATQKLGHLQRSGQTTQKLLKNNPDLLPKGTTVKVEVGGKTVTGRVQSVGDGRVTMRYRHKGGGVKEIEVPLNKVIGEPTARTASKVAAPGKPVGKQRTKLDRKELAREAPKSDAAKAKPNAAKPEGSTSSGKAESAKPQQQAKADGPDAPPRDAPPGKRDLGGEVTEPQIKVTDLRPLWKGDDLVSLPPRPGTPKSPPSGPAPGGSPRPPGPAVNAPKIDPISGLPMPKVPKGPFRPR